MVAFYLDEDVPEDLAPLLDDRGHFATTTREGGRKGAPDYRQLWFAAECGWTLIAMNRKDYLMLHGAWLLWAHEWGVSHHHAGVLLLPQVRRSEHSVVAVAVHDLVRDASIVLTNSVYDWHRVTNWRRSPR